MALHGTGSWRTRLRGIAGHDEERAFARVGQVERRLEEALRERLVAHGAGPQVVLLLDVQQVPSGAAEREHEVELVRGHAPAVEVVVVAALERRRDRAHGAAHHRRVDAALAVDLLTAHDAQVRAERGVLLHRAHRTAALRDGVGGRPTRPRR